MSFSDRAKLKALAIVRIFETSKPFGDYEAVAVLNDGAGVSYGAYQFTHRSGSLYDVVVNYLGRGGIAGRTILVEKLPILQDKSAKAINVLSHDVDLKAALRMAGRTDEMHEAQHQVALTRYLKPAIEACEGSNFILPLSLAVVYDSINHGSYGMIRDRVTIKREVYVSDIAFERAWITQYVGARDFWLESVPRLAPTDYRTDFFLAQIARKNWDLDLPVNVHGHTLTENEIGAVGTVRIRPEAAVSETPAESLPSSHKQVNGENNKQPQTPPTVLPVDARPADETEHFSIGEAVESFDKVFGQVERIGQGIKQRSDAVKSFWTTVVGTLWQTVLAVVAFLAGIPKEVWLVIAIVSALLALLYLYRQISLGRIREMAEHGVSELAQKL